MEGAKRLRPVMLVAVAGGAFAGGVSVLRQRRNPEPFPAARAGMLVNSFTSAHARATLAYVDVGPGMSVLDFGCGPGRLSIPLALRVGPAGRLAAVDIQQGMLDVVAGRARHAGITNLETVRAAAGEGGIEPEAFDRALLASVLGEIPAEMRTSALRQIGDGLRSGGILYVIEVPGDPHYQGRRVVQRLGMEAGFRLGRSRRVWLGHVTELMKGPDPSLMGARLEEPRA